MPSDDKSKQGQLPETDPNNSMFGRGELKPPPMPYRIYREYVFTPEELRKLLDIGYTDDEIHRIWVEDGTIRVQTSQEVYKL